jgi:hypothetical protein
VQQPDARSELAHELLRIRAADLRPVDVDFREHGGREVLEQVQQRRTPVGHLRELPEVVVVAERHAPLARNRVERVEPIRGRAHGVGIGKRVGAEHGNDNGLAADLAMRVERGAELGDVLEPHVRTRDGETRVVERAAELLRRQIAEPRQLDADVSLRSEPREHRGKVGCGQLAECVELHRDRCRGRCVTHALFLSRRSVTEHWWQDLTPARRVAMLAHLSPSGGSRSNAGADPQP